MAENRDSLALFSNKHVRSFRKKRSAEVAVLIQLILAAGFPHRIFGAKLYLDYTIYGVFTHALCVR